MTASVSDYQPSGNIDVADDIFLEGAPFLWFGGEAKFSPDSDGFYWGNTGTPTNPIQKAGCYTDFRLRDNIQMTDVRCDTIGTISTIQKRNYLEVTFTLLSLLPVSQLKRWVRGGAVTHNLVEHSEKMGLGDIDNNEYFIAFFSKVYDPDAGDFFSVTGHRCQVVDAWEIAMNYGAPWTLGVRMRFYADSTKPTDQRFATFVRTDPGAL